jgi:hypothetical protein
VAMTKNTWMRFLVAASVFVSTCVVSTILMLKMSSPAVRHTVVPNLIFLSPFWLPFAFLGYVSGRKSITTTFIMVVTALEALAVAGMFVVSCGY